MYMEREKFNEIKKRFNVTILVDDDVNKALEFVCELLKAEADALREKCSYATMSIQRMERAAYEVSSMGQEIENENFGEG